MLGFGAIGQYAIGELAAGVVEAITVDKWFKSFADPVRFPPALPTSAQQFAAFNPQPFVSFGWFENLSEPVRFPPRLQEAAQQVVAFYSQPVVSFAWFANLSEPVRLVPRLPDDKQQFFAYQANPTTVTPFAWFAELSKPQKLDKPGLAASQQPFFTIDPEVIPLGRLTTWFAPLSEPVRLPARLPEGEQQFTALNPLPRVSFSWFGWLPEPVRVPARLPEDEQQFAAWTFAPSQISIGWFKMLEEPVRLPPRFRDSLRQFYVGPDRLLPTPNITATFSAIETKDVFFAGGRLWNRILSGEVGMIESTATGGQSGTAIAPQIASVQVSIRIV